MKKLTRRMRRFAGQTVGLDVHSKIIQYSVIDREGDEVANEAIGATGAEVQRLVEGLLPKGPVQVVLEATGCFLWVYDLLVGVLGREQVHVAAPNRVRVIAESGEKTDANDAWWLAYLLYEGRLPEAFVAEGDLRELRIACRELRSVTEERANLMRRLKSHLAQLGKRFAAREWSSGIGRRRIQALVDSVSEEGVRGEAIGRLWRRIQELSEERANWSRRVNELASSMPEVKLIDEAIPGIGEVIAAITWSELGDPQRYRSAKAYGKATGLTPGYRESAGRRKKGSITRDGSSHVRWALTRAVVACSRSTRGAALVIRRWVEAMKRRKSKKQAIVAAARKLAEAIWRLFRLGETFDVALAFGGRSST